MLEILVRIWFQVYTDSLCFLKGQPGGLSQSWQAQGETAPSVGLVSGIFPLRNNLALDSGGGGRRRSISTDPLLTGFVGAPDPALMQPPPAPS